MHQDKTIKVRVLVMKPGDDQFRYHPHARGFEVMPRIGEHIEIEEDTTTAYIYKVVAIVHAHQPAHTTAELFAVRVGNMAQFLKELAAEHQAEHQNSLIRG